MKYLLVLLVVLVGFWMWRQGRREDIRSRTRPTPQPKTPPAVGPPQAMVRCAHCALHLPATDALPGPGGVYCSPAHRRAGPG
ncbi:MAG: PP0621 family protein [Janthinobacterium lividum]